MALFATEGTEDSEELLHFFISVDFVFSVATPNLARFMKDTPAKIAEISLYRVFPFVCCSAIVHFLCEFGRTKATPCICVLLLPGNFRIDVIYPRFSLTDSIIIFHSQLK